MSDMVYSPELLDEPFAPGAAWTPQRARAAVIIAIAAGLMSIGAVMTFSAAASVDRAPFALWTMWKSLAVRQLLFVLAGLTAMLISMHIPYRIWSKANTAPSFAFLACSLGVLALVFVPHIGVEVNNAKRWVQFGPASLGLRFQPSELVKIALPIWLANWMTRRADVRNFWHGLVPAIMAIGICVGAVGIEDFGTAALLASVAGVMLLVGGARIWHLMLMILPAVPVFGYLLISRAHRMSRLMTFLDIWADPEGKGYQAIQSLCTIASGGYWGQGLGRGFVKTYLPEARTDFIFSVICEELGMVGAVLVIALLIAFLWQCMRVIRGTEDSTGRLLAFGIAFVFGFQAAMNIAVVTVSVPTKGIALPMVSGGGSGVIFLGLLVGVLANIARTGGNAETQKR
jgi:cell division protein FtsW